jgi:sn-glycerol 3-phosphate transport system permease protein
VCFCSAVKTEAEVVNSLGWQALIPPATPTIENFIAVLSRVPMHKFLLNTLIQCATVIVSQVIFCSLAAYALTYFEFKGKNLLFTFILTTMMIPGDVVIIANYIQIQKWNLTNTHAGMALPMLIGGMGIFLMRQYYLTLPRDLREAADIDGCGDLGFFFRIALPLSVPSLGALSIREFITVYNRYFWPLLVTNTENMRTIQLAVATLKDAEFNSTAQDMACAACCIVPVVLVFVIGHKYIVKGMTAGAVKG